MNIEQNKNKHIQFPFTLILGFLFVVCFFVLFQLSVALTREMAQLLKASEVQNKKYKISIFISVYQPSRQKKNDS